MAIAGYSGAFACSTGGMGRAGSSARARSAAPAVARPGATALSHAASISSDAAAYRSGRHDGRLG